MKEFGIHYIVEYVDCARDVIENVTSLEPIFLAAGKESNATMLSWSFKQFEPVGVSGYIFIAESHLSIHTWPEENYAAVDIFTCGKEMSAQVAIDFLENKLGAKKVIVQKLSRGVPVE